MNNNKTVCIIVDTNIWRSSLLLRTEFGPALLHILKRCNGKLGLPEIIEMEIHKQIVNAGKEATLKIEHGFREINAIMGSHSPYRIPTETDIINKISNRFNELHELIERANMTMEHVRSVITRMNAGLPPNGPNNQQFKDSMIWEAALELSKRHSVHLVTNDSGFFNRNEKDKMAPELRVECKKMGLEIYIHRELKDCIKSLRDEIPALDNDLLANAIKIGIEQQLRDYASKEFFDIGDLRSYNIDAFYTENHDILALGFELILTGIDFSSNNANPRLDPIITAKGDCKYTINQNNADHIKINEIRYKWTGINGVEEKKLPITHFDGCFYLGSGPDIVHFIKKPIQDLM